MGSDRDAMLARIREAVRAGNRPGDAAPLPERGTLGYQGDGGDPVACFRREFEAAGGKAHVVPDAATAADLVLALLDRVSARRVLLGRGPVLDRLGLEALLTTRGCQVHRTDDAATGKEETFAADVGVSGVQHLIAETGSVVVETAPDSPRSLSLLPPVHIAVAGRSQILADLFDLFAAGREMPSCLSVITGPSKTGDIELRLVTGVHGPGEIHVVVIEGL